MNIDSKIKRLKLYCENHPYAFSNVKQLKEQFTKDGKLNELNEFEELRKYYEYLRSQRSRGKISEEIKNELKNARVGGVFGFSDEDSSLMESYKIDRKIFIQFMQEFGTIENFREQYISLKVELANAKSDEERENILNSNKKILTYMDKLPLVNDYYLGGTKEYNTFVREVFIKTETNNVIIGPGIKESVDYLLGRMPKKGSIGKEVLERIYGLKDGRIDTLADIAKDSGVLTEEIRQAQMTAERELKNPVRVGQINEHIFKPNEEFVKAYFQVHDVFTDGNEPNLSEEEIGNLMEILHRKQEREMNQEETENEQSPYGELSSQILEYESQYREICAKSEEINLEISEVNKRIRDIIDYLDQCSFGSALSDVEKAVRSAIEELHEQAQVLEDLNYELAAIQEIERKIREELDELRAKGGMQI